MKLSKLSLIQREKLFKTLRLSITHHSNALEGTTLSFGETKSLLEKGQTAPNKRLDEQLIILGFADAYDTIIREANDKSKVLDASFIKDLHYIIFDKALRVTPEFVKKPIGAYRIDSAKISGVDISLSNPILISQELDNLLFRLKSNDMTLENIAEFHAEFEKIHPFSDGNGRTGRLLMAFQCIQNDMIPPLIESKCRDEYLDRLYKAQKDKDFKQFCEFLESCQGKSLHLIDKAELLEAIKEVERGEVVSFDNIQQAMDYLNAED